MEISGLGNRLLSSYLEYWAQFYSSLSKKELTNTANTEGTVRVEKVTRTNFVALKINFMGKTHNFVSQGGELVLLTRMMLSCSNKGFPSRDKIIVPLYSAFVRPHLECCVQWSPLYKKEYLDRLEKVQKGHKDDPAQGSCHVKKS